MDNLDYEYDDHSNRLLKVTDSSGSIEGFNDGNTSGDDYDYDEFGNMIVDKNKNITNISYNHLNLPTKIVFGTGAQIWYTYDAGGVKQAKKVQDGNEVTYTDYLDGFQYRAERKENSRWLFLANEPGGVWAELQFIPHAEGYVKVTYDKSGNPHYNYIYQYKDHLGNIRMNYTQKYNGDIEIVDESHYYPPDNIRDGLEHTYYNTDKKEYKQDIDTDDQVVIVQVPDRGYDYRYNGMELQDELGLNVYDYGARFYYPDVPFFWQIDPLAEDYHSQSPYVYAVNNPVYFIDKNGMGPEDVIITGTQSQAALNQLQSAVNSELTLSMDNNGNVSYQLVNSNSTLSSNAQKLVNAIDDHSVTVNVTAENTDTTSTGNLYIGGAFMGNNVDPSTGNATANQEVNPEVLSKMSNANSSPGQDTLHEVTEAYAGALLSQTNGTSSPASNQAGTVYQQAHSDINTTVPQSGTVQQQITYYGQGRATSDGVLRIQTIGPVLATSTTPLTPEPIGTVSRTVSWSSNGTIIQRKTF